MRRDLQNLERLFFKYQARYGAGDDLVLRIQETFESKKSQYSLLPQWHEHYPRILRRTGGRLAYAI